MTTSPADRLSDSQLLAETIRAAARAREATAELLALLAEVDARRLYLGLGHSSLFIYCTQALHLSECAAYNRMTAARVARRFPLALTLLVAGSVTLTTITRLSKHLTEENHEALLEAARHKTKEEIAELVAAIDPQPDFASLLRRIAVPAAARTASDGERAASLPLETETEFEPDVRIALIERPVHAPIDPRRSFIAPLAPERYLLKVTIGKETHAKLDRARALLRHTIPNGDPATVIDRALTVLVEQLERTKTGSVRSRPALTPPPRDARARGRHVPAAVKRAVWARDEGRCAFAGSDGRCTETTFLEYHHVVPFARGGTATVANLTLRCRAHNAYEADRDGLCLDRVRALCMEVGSSDPATQ